MIQSQLLIFANERIGRVRFRNSRNTRSIALVVRNFDHIIPYPHQKGQQLFQIHL